RELLDPVVAILYHVETSSAVAAAESEIVGIRELPGLQSRRAPAADELPIAREHLNAMVASVGHVQVAVFGTEGQGPSAGELAGLRSGTAPALDKSAIGVELADPMGRVELGDVIVAVFILHDIADVAELPRTFACLAADLADLPGSFAPVDAVERIDADAIVVRIADEEIAVPVDAQP